MCSAITRSRIRGLEKLIEASVRTCRSYDHEVEKRGPNYYLKLCRLSKKSRVVARALEMDHSLVAEWIHFTLLGIILPTIKPKVYTFGGLMNSATKRWIILISGHQVDGDLEGFHTRSMRVL